MTEETYMTVILAADRVRAAAASSSADDRDGRAGETAERNGHQILLYTAGGGGTYTSTLRVERTMPRSPSNRLTGSEDA